MKSFLIGLYFLPLVHCFAQQDRVQERIIDTLYREDQLYAAVTYNALIKMNPGISQNGFSTGFYLGFLRDMPLNKRRNIALALGVGISSNSYLQNIAITQSENGYEYNLLPDNITVSRNKFTTYLIDIPFEFRWRTSTPTINRFWRIYPGFKFSYLLYNSTKLQSDFGNENLSNVRDFEDLQYGLTLGVGYGDWNFHFYYGLNPIFKNSAQLNGESLGITAMKIGIIFYIL